ncbi:Meckel syndrome type 1 protein [Novymonas esmeraldas]|uniref:Meckel syndrome type 1 protein n=1 Tax=Novymonas esmeraldas TaxID=1808958 RepID=A0AAW0EQW6_9TRYP
MEFLHFAGSQRYRSRVPLQQLRFTVAVYRAIVVEEDKRELLVEATVPWDGKVFSPAETLSLYTSLTRLSRAETATTAPPPPVQCDDGTAAAPDAPVPTSHTLLPLLPNMPSLPTAADVLHQLRRPQSCFFTRPSLEDFIDSAEEDVPVDPPQGPSLLAPVILRQHRRDHQPNRRMYIMWAAGEVRVPGQSGEPPATEQSEAVEGGPWPHSAASPHNVLAAASTVAETAATAGTADLEAARWVGTERVLCTVTAEQDERRFTAKPSLGEWHTLFVDAAYIYTFCVSVSHADAAAAPGRRAASAGEAAQRSATADAALSPSSIAPLELLLTSVRDLALRAEEQYASLELGKDAVARALLRQAAMMALPERGGLDGAAATPSMAATASSAADSTQRRRGRAAAGHHSALHATGADRGGAGGVSAALASSSSRPHRGAASGVALLSRAGVMRSAPALPRGLCQYYVFGTVDRCVGVAEPTLFVRCELAEDGAAAAGATAYAEPPPPSAASPGTAPSSSSSTVATFTSQLADVGAVVEAESVLDVAHVFNLPFEYSCVGAVVPHSPLRLVVTAFTEGPAAAGLQAPVAYACVSLPMACPGRHAVTAPLWAPHKTGVEYLRSSLLGGAPALVDAHQAGPAAAHRTGAHVKLGLHADTVGTLHMTVHVLHHKNRDAS